MTKNPNFSQLSTAALLELSMSIGKYGDFEKSAGEFTTCLKKLLDFSICEIWHRDHPDARNFSKIFKHHKNIIRSSIFEYKHAIAKFKKNQFYHTTILDGKEKGTFDGFTDLDKGTIYAFKLSEFSILLAYQIPTQPPVSKGNLSLLQPFFQRFGISLEQSYSNKILKQIEHGVLNSKEELQKYKLVVENVSEGLIIINKDLEVAFANQRLSELSEYPTEEIIGKPVGKLLLDEVKVSKVKTIFKKVIKGESIEFSTEHTRKVSKTKWWAIAKISPYKNTNGKIVGVIAIIRDITVEKLAQQALKASQDRYNLLIDHGFDGVMLYDLKEQKVLSVNDTLLKNFGYTREEFVQIDLEKAAPKIQANGQNSFEYLESINKKLLKSGKINYEWVHKKKDGSLFYVDIIAVQLEAPNGHIKIEIHKDITEKYLSEKALKENEIRLSKLFNMSPVPILIRSINSSQFKQVNRKFVELYGYTLDEINTMDRDNLVHWENAELIQSNMKKLINGEITDFKTEKQYIRKDGSLFWGAATRSLVKIDDELLIIGFIEDITARKKAIAAMKESEAKVRAIFDSTADKIEQGNFLPIY